MKQKFSLFILALCCVLMFSIASFGAGKASSEAPAVSKEKIEENATDPANPAGAPKIFAAIREHKFPSVLDGEEVINEFIIQNTGTAELKINKVKTG